MSPYIDRTRWSALARRVFTIVCLIACGTWAGCGAGVSPEQKAAMTRIAELGGRVNFKRGGYEIDLTKTPVEDKDIKHLKKIPNLKNVDLQGTRITDAAVDLLCSIDTLEFVYIQRTIITPEAAERLKKALPNAEVNY